MCNSFSLLFKKKKKNVCLSFLSDQDVLIKFLGRQIVQEKTVWFVRAIKDDMNQICHSPAKSLNLSELSFLIPQMAIIIDSFFAR